MHLTVWNDPTMRGSHSGEPLAIVGTGPSHDLLHSGSLDGFKLFVLNGAITEYFKQGPWWICHDLWKVGRFGLRGRISDYRHWNVVSRRVYIPGEFGDVPWREADKTSTTSKFPARLVNEDVARISNYYWYNELKGQQGYLQAEETCLEVALETATFWGFDPIVLVGVDMKPVDRHSYAKAWSWKKCLIKGSKFEKMKKRLTEARARWSKNIFTISPYWNGKFERIKEPRACLSSTSFPLGLGNDVERTNVTSTIAPFTSASISEA